MALVAALTAVELARSLFSPAVLPIDLLLATEPLDILEFMDIDLDILVGLILLQRPRIQEDGALCFWSFWIFLVMLMHCLDLQVDY